MSGLKSKAEADKVMDIAGQILVAFASAPGRTPEALLSLAPKLINSLERSYLSLLGDDESPNKN